VIDYQYDENGRLTSIDYQNEKSHDSTITYDTLVSNEDITGIAAGMLRRRIKRGNYQKDSYFDGLYRPQFQVEQDITDSSTISYMYTEFNSYNKNVFTSYPSEQVNRTLGTLNIYDGLQRQVQSVSASDIGDIITKHSYMANNAIEVIDSKGNVTNTIYESYGKPAYEKPSYISNKMVNVPNIETKINYNIFGNPTTLTQGGVTQTNIYNEQQKLCLTTRADVGSRMFGYSDIGELTWDAFSGHKLNASACLSSVPVNNVTSFIYDNLGQQASKKYYDATSTLKNAIGYEYDLSGNVIKAIQANGTVNAYIYNTLGQLSTETLQFSGGLLNIEYDYDGLGNIVSTTYPSGLLIKSDLNALGNASKVFTSKNVFAKEATYHAGGQLESFIFGNGYAFHQILNTRQLPKSVSARLGELTALDFSYGYDKKANVTTIEDHVDFRYDVDMGYDALDRLTTVDGKWGSGSIGYDSLGNIQSYALGTERLGYEYSNNKLKAVTGSKNIDFVYDDRGNVTSRSLNGVMTLFDFNPANQMVSANGVTYAYDAQGRRISVGNLTELTKVSMYNLAGKLLYQRDNNTGKITEHIYLGSKLVAKVSNVPGMPTIRTPERSVDGNIIIGWTNVASATSYTLEKSSNGLSWKTLYTGNSLSFKHSLLVNGTYHFRVKACSDKGCGSYSEPSSVDVLLVPKMPNSINVPNIVVKNGAFTVSWSASPTATAYTLRQRINNGSWTTIASTANTHFNFTGKPTGSYSFGVTACNASGCSNCKYSNSVTVLLPPLTPSNIVVPTVTIKNGVYSVRWNSSATATRYTLRQSTNGGGWVTVATPSNTNYSFNGKSNGTYRYAISACNSSGCSGYKYSTTFTVLLAPPKPNSVSAPTATVKNGAYTISWASSNTAATYTLRQSVNGGRWTTVASATTTSHRFSGKYNAAYRYAVNACNASGCSAYQYSATFKVLLPPPIITSLNLASFDLDGVYNLSWGASPTTTYYTILESVNGGRWNTVNGSTTATNYRKSGAQSGKYKYAVRACNSSGCSGYKYSTMLVNTLAPSYVSVPSITHGSTITMTWGSVATRTRYLIQEKIGSGGWTTIVASTTSTRYSRPQRGSNTYQYRVSACNSAGCSAYRTSRVATVVLAPSSINYSGKDHDGSFGIRWGRVNTATSYQVQQLYSGRWTTVYNSSALSATMSGRADGNYYYRVRACNSNSCSGYTQGGKLWVVRPHLNFSLSKTYLNTAENITINWSARGADSCNLFNRTRSVTGGVGYYANCSKTISMSCKYGSQSVTKSQSVLVKYGSRSCFDFEDEF